MSTSIIFHVTVSLLFALMSLVLLILSSFVFMTSTFPLLHKYVIVTQTSFPDVYVVYAYRVRLLLYQYCLAALEDCDFLNESFSFEFLFYGSPSSRRVYCL